MLAAGPQDSDQQADALIAAYQAGTLVADRCRELIVEPSSAREKCRVLNRVLFHEWGFHGNVEHWLLGRPDPQAMLLEFGRRGLTRVLVEGGARLAGALMKAGLVDRIAWFRAPLALGGDGVPALEPLGIADPDAAARWTPVDARRLGDDVLETYAPPG